MIKKWRYFETEDLRRHVIRKNRKLFDKAVKQALMNN